MKLELKYFAAYLPHKLKCTCIKSDSKFVKDFGIKEIIGLSFNINRECFVGIFQNSELDINKIIPFLHPLSDLTKEIEVNGEKFFPIERLRSEFSNIYFEIGILNSLVIKGKNENFIIYSSTILINEKLCEWHFDIFGLVDAGLAVDINTVKF